MTPALSNMVFPPREKQNKNFLQMSQSSEILVRIGINREKKEICVDLDLIATSFFVFCLILFGGCSTSAVKRADDFEVSVAGIHHLRDFFLFFLGLPTFLSSLYTILFIYFLLNSNHLFVRLYFVFSLRGNFYTIKYFFFLDQVVIRTLWCYKMDLSFKIVSKIVILRYALFDC